MIELKNLEKKYDNVTPLKDVNAVIEKGDVISVIGPSGTGKSTLLRCINMLERPTGGSIIFDGEDITAPKYDLTLARRRMGMVFQSFNLFGHLTVIENLMLAPVDILKKTKKEAYENGIALLKRVGLAGREFQYPDQLSGGQKQRVAIARTLAMDPDVILLDEPTSALDPTMVGEVQSVISDLAHSGKTMLIVTHEMRFARAICNRVFYMDQSGIYEDGPPQQVFDNPKKELTRRFIHQLKVLEIVIDDREYDNHGISSLIEEYCMRNVIPARVRYRLQLIFEELVQQILLPVLAQPAISFLAEYSESERTLGLTVKYNGESFDPADSQNTLSYSVLKGTTFGLCHTIMQEEGYTNCVKCMITE